MKILFDQGTPAPLRRHLREHFVATAYEMGWADLSNGDLLSMAEADGFESLITTDQNLRYQQNLSQRRIAILTLLSTSWPRIRLRVADIHEVVNSMLSGGYAEIAINQPSE